MTFWDIQDYLMTDEIVSITTDEPLEGISSILYENTNEVKDTIIPTNTYLKVPLWIAIALIKCNSATLNQPVYLSTKFYNQLLTDSIIINMKAKNHYFYDISLILLSYMDLEHDWINLIWQSAAERFLYIYKNTNNEEFENYTLSKKLCYREKELYKYQLDMRENYRTYILEYIKVNKEEVKIKRRVHLNNTMQAKKVKI